MLRVIVMVGSAKASAFRTFDSLKTVHSQSSDRGPRRDFSKNTREKHGDGMASDQPQLCTLVSKKSCNSKNAHQEGLGAARCRCARAMFRRFRGVGRFGFDWHGGYWQGGVQEIGLTISRRNMPNSKDMIIDGRAKS